MHAFIYFKVLKESLRLAPPVVAIQRNNTEDLIVNGVKIPAGSNIELNNYALSRDQRFWDEPETFKPERFKAETNRNPYAYFPFALGPRVCIGQHFAMIEAKVIMSKIFQAFNFSLVPGVELRCINDMTLQPLDKTPLYLTLRKGDN
ncbi:Cholesterol 24-hydroxylase [Apostichopus japonicus]|uniref:Cholesterol 24-hydroxylase n=1 Tax=Stichopus japonicus TaxID=307972 RepID=A0A2G8K2J2_STIJA|nr:Cholesterol 24-hydroxylase [Apostichopus japonicus]